MGECVDVDGTLRYVNAPRRTSNLREAENRNVYSLVNTVRFSAEKTPEIKPIHEALEAMPPCQSHTGYPPFNRTSSSTSSQTDVSTNHDHDHDQDTQNNTRSPTQRARLNRLLGSTHWLEQPRGTRTASYTEHAARRTRNPNEHTSLGSRAGMITTIGEQSHDTIQKHRTVATTEHSSTPLTLQFELFIRFVRPLVA